LKANIPGSVCSVCTDVNCKDCPDDKCVSCDDNYFLENEKCVKCDDSCLLKCTGAGNTKCTDNKCNPIGYVYDAAVGCKSCEVFKANCYKCTSGVCE
jgi:hypothetical protein